MEKTEISFINQDFSLKAFVTIIKKQLWLVLLIFAISIFCGFIYMRYTLPVYQTTTIIQIKSENRTNQLLGFNNTESKEMVSAVELLKSNEFLKSIINNLSLDVTYYMKGKIIDSEYYRNSPFKIDYKIKNPSIYDTKIEIEIINEKECEISYELKNKNYKHIIEFDEWQNLDNLDICVDNISANNKNKYYFIINNPRTTLKHIKERFEIQGANDISGSIILTYRDYNADKAADIVNTIADKFLVFDVETKRKNSDRVVEYIDFQINNIQKNIGDGEQNLENFKIENNIYPANETMISNKSNTLADQITLIENNLLNIDFEITTLDDIINRIKTEKELKTYEIFTLLAGKQSESVITSLINSIHSLTTKKELLLFDITESTSKIKIIDQQIEDRKRTVIEFIEFSKNRLLEQKNHYTEKLKEIETKLYSKVENDFDKIEYSNLQRIVKLNQDYYSKLLQAKLETLVAQAGYISNNLILEKANVPDTPFSPDLKKVMLVAIVIGLILSILFCFVKYMFYSKIISVSDITTYTDIPVLNSIPHVNQKMDNSEIVVHLRPKSSLTEAFRNIRTKLDFFPIESKCRVITVSSTVSAEGKTFVSLNIAAIYAMREMKTIILDLDLRKPRIHKAFKVSNAKGISTILTNQTTIQECIKHSDIENLDYITSGVIPPNPAELVISKRYTNLINELKNIYDIIIIDTPPIGIVIDAIYSYKLADNKICAMRSQYSNRNVITNLIQLQKNNDLKNMSIVLNDVKGNSGSNGYGNYYGNKYYYGEDEEKQSNFLTRIFKWEE